MEEPFGEIWGEEERAQRGASQSFLLHFSPPFSLSIALLLRSTITFPCAVRMMFSAWNAKTRRGLMGLFLANVCQDQFILRFESKICTALEIIDIIHYRSVLIRQC